MTFGIAGTGYALGERCIVAEAVDTYAADRERIDDWGYRAFHRAADDVGLTDLATVAAGHALDQAGIPPSAVDLLVLATADIVEYLYWDAAAAVQGRLGAHRAEVLPLTLACGAGVAAFDLIAGKFATHPDYRVALLVSANRVCEAYWSRMESSTSISSDGAAAAVAIRDHPAMRWLATEVVSDGRYADLVRLDVGGAARPFVAGQPGPMPVHSPFQRLEDHFGHDVRAMADFVRQVRSGSRAAFDRACDRAQVCPAEVAHLIHLHDNRTAVTNVAHALGIPVERTNLDLAMEHGHLGSADQLFGLDRLVASGRAVPGDVVALTSVGSGMHWVCTLLRA